MGDSINISEYLEMIKKRKVVIIAIVFISMLAGGLLQFMHNKSYIPTYTSTVSVRININKRTEKEPSEKDSKSDKDDKKSKDSNTEDSSKSTVSYGTLESSTINQNISDKYSSLAVSKRAMMDLINRMNLNTTPEFMQSQITVTPEENLSEFIDISVTNTNAQLAQKIAKEMPDVFNEEIKKVIGLDCVEVLYDATEPSVNPKPQDNTFRNFSIIGIVIAIFIVLLLECLDNKVVTPDDAEKYWDLPVIGVVPFEKENAKGKKIKEVKAVEKQQINEVKA